MQITIYHHEDRHELQLDGRLDANWAPRLGQAIETAIQSGHHHLDLEFSRVSYVSSAGIRVLLQYLKQLRAVTGVLRVLRPTEGVLNVLQLSGIAGLLVAPPESDGSGLTSVAAEASTSPETIAWEVEGLKFERYSLDSSAQLVVSFHGRPSGLEEGSLTSAYVQELRCESDLVAVGLGAFGSHPIECLGRYGETLAVCGAAMTMSTDGSHVPDYQVSEGRLVPELQLLYGLSARGAFTSVMRFEAGRSSRGVLGLSEMVECALEAHSFDAAAFVIVAETAGLVGATLLQSPDGLEGRSPLAFPEVRDWMSFTTERTQERHVALIVGFTSTTPVSEGLPFLRRIGPGTRALGHFHAAVFPYRPLPKGKLELAETVQSLFSTSAATTVMHLLADDREFEGVGETDFLRGACWTGPLSGLEMAPQTDLKP